MASDATTVRELIRVGHPEVEPGLCACGWYSTGDGRIHCDHLAAVLEAEVIRPREREAWRLGVRWTGLNVTFAETSNPFADDGGEDRG